MRNLKYLCIRQATQSEIHQQCSIILFTCESDRDVHASHLRAVGWSAVPLQLLVLLQLNQALLVLHLLGDGLQLLRVQLGVQGAHLPNGAADRG